MSLIHIFMLMVYCYELTLARKVIQIVGIVKTFYG